MEIDHEAEKQEERRKHNTIRLSILNLANSGPDEESPRHHFSLRMNRIADEINKSESSVVCLSEIRVCSNINKTHEISPEELGIRLANMCKMDVAALRPHNLTHKSFWRMTMKQRDLTTLQTFCRYAIIPNFEYKTQADGGVMFIFTQFCTAAGTKFWVINAHMPLALDMKITAIKWLNDNALTEIIKAGIASFEPIFYGGDQNTFSDNGGNDMMKLFAEKWTHLTPGDAPTFIPFPHDKFQTPSVLDHIFAWKFPLAKDIMYLIKNHGVINMNGASDHNIVYVDIELA